MVSVIVHEGDDEKPSYIELAKEVEKLREKDCERENRIKVLANDNRKTKERLRVLEGLIECLKLERISNENERKGNTESTGAINERFVKTFIELTCECVVINKKLKYLRKLMKLNTRKLRDLENITKAGEGKELKSNEDKICQTELSDDKEEVTSTCNSQEFRVDSASSDADTLMSEMFYLPTHPDLPDLRLFSLL